jgi:hypothetical protein
MQNRFRGALTAALLLALCVRILPATYHYIIGSDEAQYLTLAGHLAAGDGFTADGIHPHTEFDPGYPLFAAAIYRLTGVSPFAANNSPAASFWLELPARVNILLLGSLLAVPIYFLARAFEDANGKSIAWRAALLTATLPALALDVPNFEAASEQLYSLALWSGWFVLWLGLEKRHWYLFALSGLAFGVAHLTRWEGIASAGIAFLVAVVWGFRSHVNGHPSLGAVLIAQSSALALLVGVLAFAAPYAIYQTARTGSFFSTKAIVHQLHGEALNSPDPFAWEKAYDNYERVRDNPSLYPPLPVYLWEHREQTSINYIRNTFTQLKTIFTSPTFLFILWLPFAIVGARKMTRRQNLFLAATLFPLVIFPLSVVDARYLLPLVPAGMIWTARGLIEADRWTQTRLTHYASPITPGISRYGITLTLIAIFVVSDIAAMFFIPRPLEYRSAGLALRGQIPPNAPVLMRRRQFAFYANVSYESLPFSDLQGVLDLAHTKGANYFMVDARSTPSTRPQLAYLLNDVRAPQAQIFYENDIGAKVIVYRIVK